MTARTDRIDELFRQEIGKILAREVADPRIGFATITDVETTADLRHARVWVSVIGQKDQREETVRVLEHAMPFVRHELGTRLRLKRIPEFHVRLDDSAERGTRVLHLLSELESGDLPEGRPEGESLPTPVPRLPHEGDAPEAHVPDDAIERPPRVVIDHHVSSEASGAADWIDPAAAATCEMAALLAVRLGIPLQAADGRLAAILTAGIVMDTATFAHPSTTARTLAVAAALVEAGAPLSEISRRLYRSAPEGPRSIARSRRLDRPCSRRPAGSPRPFGADEGRDERRPRPRETGRPDLPRHGGPCPPPHRNQAGGPRWDARPVRERGAAHL